MLNMRYKWLLVGYFLLITTVDSNNADNETVIEKWERLESNLQTVVDGLIKWLQPVVKEFTLQNVSSECRESLNIVSSGIRRLQTWALKFIDSTGRPMANIMAGCFSSPGLFDECIGIKVSEEICQLYGNRSKLSFRGQYCSIKVRPPLPPKPKTYSIIKPLPEFAKFKRTDQSVEWTGYRYAQILYLIAIRFGICFPSTCSRKDIKNIIEEVMTNSSLIAEINHCEIEEYNLWKSEQIIACLILAIPVMFALAGTCVSAYLRIKKMQFIVIAGKSRRVLTRLLDAFSLHTNVKRIMDTENTDETLSCLHGMRFLSLSWVVLGHTYFFANFQQIRNMRSVPQMAGKLMFQLIANASPCVDTFFFMSGLLLVYVAFEKLKAAKIERINIPFLICHRIWRLWPPLITTILFVFFVPWTGSGPYWHEKIDPIVNNCRDKWWATLIFVNNFFRGFKICLPHTWYVSCDFQLYVLGIFLLAILLRRPILAFTVNAVLSVIGMAITGYITKIRELPPTMLFQMADEQGQEKVMGLVYFPPYAHVGAYSIGMAVGYLLHKQKKISIKPMFKLLGWIVAITCNLSIVLASTPWNRGEDISPVTAILYASLHRTAWTIGVAWLTILCCTGNCEIIRKFLSWGAFIPLSRLTFFAYLLHYLVVNASVVINRQTYHVEHIYAVNLFFANLTVTYLLSLIASLLFESPLLALEKILFSVGRKTTNDVNKTHESCNSTPEKCYGNQNHISPSTIVSRF